MRNAALYGVWTANRKAICLLLFVLVFGAVVGIGKLFGVDLRRAESFEILAVLASVGIAILLFSALERLIFGVIPTGTLPTWLKAVVGIGVAAAIALAVWDGIDARMRAKPPERLSNMFITTPAVNSAQMANVQALRRQQRSGGTKGSPPASP